MALRVSGEVVGEGHVLRTYESTYFLDREDMRSILALMFLLTSFGL